MANRFEHHARNVSLLTLLSRITGLVRDATISRVFGGGMVTGAFFFAFMLPNLFRRLFGEGALAAAFLPEYAKLDRDDPAMARKLAHLTIAVMVMLLGTLVLVGEAALYIASSMQGHGNLALWLMMITLPYMPLVCIVAMLGAMLQVHGRFGPTASAPVVLNLCIIGAAVGVPWMLGTPALEDAERDRLMHVGAVAGSIVLAGTLQVMWSYLALRRFTRLEKGWRAAREPMKRVLKQALPMIIGLGVLQLNTLFDGIIASYPIVVGDTIFGRPYPLDEDAMAAVSFAQRLYQFPLGVFGIAVATALFPLLAKLADDENGFVDVIRRGLRLVVFIGVPASIGLIFVREPMADVILRGGQFTSDDSARVGFVLLGYAPAIWAYSMVHVLTRAFYARGESMTPVRIAIGVVGLNLVFNCSLIWTPLRESGLAWSTAVCSVVQVCLLASMLRRRTLQLLDRTVVGSWLRTAAISAAMVGFLLAVQWMLPSRDTWSDALLHLLALVGVGMVVIACSALALKMPEMKWAVGRR
jgi:putative peptidoglycan lipid II flippase